MNPKQDEKEDILVAAESVLRDAAARLRELLAELAQSLRPFPAFLNMDSLQAVELEPPSRPPRTMAAWWCCPRARSARWTCR